ncbi:MAG: hypothetical protein R8M45_04280, partial [Ghiorsea sp.]
MNILENSLFKMTDKEEFIQDDKEAALAVAFTVFGLMGLYQSTDNKSKIAKYIKSNDFVSINDMDASTLDLSVAFAILRYKDFFNNRTKLVKTLTIMKSGADIDDQNMIDVMFDLSNTFLTKLPMKVRDIITDMMASNITPSEMGIKLADIRKKSYSKKYMDFGKLAKITKVDSTESSTAKPLYSLYPQTSIKFDNIIRNLFIVELDKSNTSSKLAIRLESVINPIELHPDERHTLFNVLSYILPYMLVMKQKDIDDSILIYANANSVSSRRFQLSDLALKSNKVKKYSSVDTIAEGIIDHIFSTQLDSTNTIETLVKMSKDYDLVKKKVENYDSKFAVGTGRNEDDAKSINLSKRIGLNFTKKQVNEKAKAIFLPLIRKTRRVNIADLKTFYTLFGEITLDKPSNKNGAKLVEAAILRDKNEVSKHNDLMDELVLWGKTSSGNTAVSEKGLRETLVNEWIPSIDVEKIRDTLLTQLLNKVDHEVTLADNKALLDYFEKDGGISFGNYTDESKTKLTLSLEALNFIRSNIHYDNSELIDNLTFKGNANKSPLVVADELDQYMGDVDFTVNEVKSIVGDLFKSHPELKTDQTFIASFHESLKVKLSKGSNGDDFTINAQAMTNSFIDAKIELINQNGLNVSIFGLSKPDFVSEVSNIPVAKRITKIILNDTASVDILKNEINTAQDINDKSIRLSSSTGNIFKSFLNMVSDDEILELFASKMPEEIIKLFHVVYSRNINMLPYTIYNKDKNVIASKIYIIMKRAMETDKETANLIYQNAPRNLKTLLKNSFGGKELIVAEMQNSIIPTYSDDLTTDDMEKLLAYNDLDINELPLPKVTMTKKMGFTGWVDKIKEKAQNSPNLLGNINAVDDNASEETLLSLSKDKVDNYHAGNHGNIYPIIEKVFTVSLPRDRFDEFKAKMGKDNTLEQIFPSFHGTGGIAANMILRYGFKIIPAGDPSSTGRAMGDGIYIADKIDKSLQYCGNAGFDRKIGSKGFIFDLESVLGIKGKDYRDDRGFNFKSKEWMLADGTKQLRFIKAYQIVMVDHEEYNKRTAGLNEGVMGFKSFLKESKATPAHIETFIFHAGEVLIVGKRGSTIIDSSKVKGQLLPRHATLGSERGKLTISFPSNKTV